MDERVATGAGPAARDAWRERYGGAETAVPAQWNGILEHLLAHRSVRAYRPDPLPAGTIETLVAAAQSAASSSNLQTWSVVAVESAERRAEFAAWAGNQRHIVDAPLMLVFVADLARAGGIATRAGITPEALDYVELTLVATVDAALAAQNAVVAAESLGLGTVYIGAIRNRVADVARVLNLPPHAYPVFGLVVGWPDTTKPAAVKPRLPQSVVLHRETYDATGEAEAIAAYDARMDAFQASQGMPPDHWTQKIAKRVASAASLNGRDKLRDALTALGLPLK
jgi:nitroreductase